MGSKSLRLCEIPVSGPAAAGSLRSCRHFFARPRYQQGKDANINIRSQ
jgi:hypothetical protein